MRPIRLRSAAALLATLATVACVAPERPAPAPPAALPPPRPAYQPPRPRAQPTTEFLNAIQALGSGFAGSVAIAIREVDEGWSVTFNADKAMPQQSVSKLWVAITLLDQVDRGELSLDDRVTVRKSDLTVFHQPIRAEIGPDGFETTLRDLLTRAMTQSDNTANDVLLRKAGGPAAVRRMLAAKGVAGVRFGPGEPKLQAHTAGLEWQSEWAGGWGFLQARAALTYEARAKALQAYLDDPEDGASANGIVAGLALLARGQLLSPASTAHLIGLMRASRTGPLRLKSGLPAGWSAAHKTGTGQDLNSWSTGYNDVALVSAPNGHRFAVAVLIASTRQPIPARMRLMGDVSRALVRATTN